MDELVAIAEPVLEMVLEQPFWRGLADGSLPPAALAAFVAQDVHHLLPTYARALARTAAASPSEPAAALLGRSVFASLEARDRLLTTYRELAAAHGWPDPEAYRAPAGPTRAHGNCFTAASVHSFAAGVGALLPMVWFNHRVTEHLLAGHTPGSRYAGWIEAYHPGPQYRFAVRAYLELAATVAEDPAGAATLVDHFTFAASYEPEFAHTTWNLVHPTERTLA